MKQIILVNYARDSAEIEAAGFLRDSQDTKDFGRVVLGGGYAGISAPTHLPIVARS
ncbi:hypothetical protein [Rhodopila sp.]|uniref:hypothetical protein n=1 Tax=Rhodopila sp. TaxID=2480087 RepID=UPI003D12F21C